MEAVYILQHPRAVHLERCLQEFLISRGVLIFHQETGRASEMAAAGEGNQHIVAALNIALSAGGVLCSLGGVVVDRVENKGDCVGEKLRLRQAQTVAEAEPPTDASGSNISELAHELTAAAASLSTLDAARYVLVALGGVDSLQYECGEKNWFRKIVPQPTPPEANFCFECIGKGIAIMNILASEVRDNVLALATCHPQLLQLADRFAKRAFRTTVVADLADMCTVDFRWVRQNFEDKRRMIKEREWARAERKKKMKVFFDPLPTSSDST
jgi:hypothetical protein